MSDVNAALRARGAQWLPCIGVVLLSLALNTWALSRAGYGNTYYAAAVRSMTMSWKNFFFGAFDPGAFITVDKPPVFLWVGALSARIFGYSSWSILLPSAAAGAASVGLLWVIVRRYFGVVAATVAGVVLALSPVSVTVDRLNLPEPFMILALLGAAGALLQSLESRRWWAWTALAGALVGVAFNTKMLAAWIPGPAFALAVIIAAPAISWATVRMLLGRLILLAAVTLVVSGSWMFIVDAWPASSRPYIGGSTNNSELDLALGYNGFGRVDGEDQLGGGGRAGPVGGGATRFGGGQQTQPARPGTGAIPPRTNTQTAPTGNGNRGAFNGPGGIFGGVPGVLRMFDDANGGQIGWLLPFALGGGLISIWYYRRDPTRRAFAVLFVGWIVLYGAIFSYAQGIFHSYYTSAMAPAVAALAGVTVAAMASAVRRDRRWLIAVVALVVVTAWAQLQIAGRTPDFYGWVRPMMLVAVVAGIAGIAVLAGRRRPVMAGLVLSLSGLLLLPAAWSLSAATNSSLNATLPQAGPQAGASGQTFGSQAFDDGTPGLAAWLTSQDQSGTTWQLAVPSSQNGSRLIAQYGLSVMALGGFLGSDNAISVDSFADLVSSGAVRYVLVRQGPGNVRIPPGRAFPGFGRPGSGGTSLFGAGSVTTAQTSGPNAVLSAVQSACAPVSDPTLPAAYRGALYDCTGAAAAMRQQLP